MAVSCVSFLMYFTIAVVPPVRFILIFGYAVRVPPFVTVVVAPVAALPAVSNPTHIL